MIEAGQLFERGTTQLFQMEAGQLLKMGAAQLFDMCVQLLEVGAV